MSVLVKSHLTNRNYNYIPRQATLMKLSRLSLTVSRDMLRLCPFRRTMLGRCVVHIFTISLLLDACIGSNFHRKVIHDTQRNTIWCLIIRTILETFLAHIKAMFEYFYHFFSYRCLKWLNFLLKRHALQKDQYNIMVNYWGSIWAISPHFRGMFGPFSSIICF